MITDMDSRANIKEALTLDLMKFFTLPDTEKEVGFFWHDKDGSSINIFFKKLNNTPIIRTMQTLQLIRKEVQPIQLQAFKDLRLRLKGAYLKPFIQHQTKYATTREDFELIPKRT